MSNRCNGARFRGPNEQRVATVPHRVYCPEIGTHLVCCACFRDMGVGTKSTDLYRHQREHCDDWNALFKIHNGYVRQFHQGRAPMNVQSPRHILGEHYRLVRDFFHLPPHVIMDQGHDWGPYDPIQPPPGSAPNILWAGISYEVLLVGALARLPPTMAWEPRPDVRAVAVRRAIADRHNTSYHHEIAVLEEQRDLQAICRFMEEHLPLQKALVQANGTAANPAGGIPGNDWHNTAIYHSLHPAGAGAVMFPPVAGAVPPTPHWCEIAAAGQGVAGTGSVGVAQSLVNFQAAHANNQFVAQIPPRELRRGRIRMGGTPRRH